MALNWRVHFSPNSLSLFPWTDFIVKLFQDVNHAFRLYITTKLANPSFTPEISAKTSVIDFTVTIKGLEDQLLGLTILKEKAELEAERVKMLEDIQANNKRMKELEDNLLMRLSNSKVSSSFYYNNKYIIFLFRVH